MEAFEILDLYGNKKTFTLSEVRAELKRDYLCNTVIPFKMVNGVGEPIEGRESEISTRKEYWSDARMKVKHAKKGTQTTVVLTDNKSGYNDYDVFGNTVYRAKVVFDIEVGDIFNVYIGESSKEGVVWQGDIITSLTAADY